MQQHRFECQPKCTACCEQNGYVNLTEKDVDNIAGYLELSKSEFEAKYIHRKPYLRRLNTPKDQPCPFLDKGQGCRIHPVKPTQCRLFPFWPNTAATEEDWQRTAESCPGIGQGPLIQIETIQQALEEMRTSYPGFYD